MALETRAVNPPLQAPGEDSSLDWRCYSFCCHDEIVSLVDSLVTELEARGYSHREVFGIRLAMEEAMVNAVKHGHQWDTNKRATLRILLAPKSVLCEIEDQGPGFKPEAVPDPCAPENLERPSGRGLLLMRRFMTWMKFNARGNKVTLCRVRAE
jgi:serine/threonine-protein kinase RsbW